MPDGEAIWGGGAAGSLERVHARGHHECQHALIWGGARKGVDDQQVRLRLELLAGERDPQMPKPHAPKDGLTVAVGARALPRGLPAVDDGIAKGESLLGGEDLISMANN